MGKGHCDVEWYMQVGLTESTSDLMCRLGINLFDNDIQSGNVERFDSSNPVGSVTIDGPLCYVLLVCYGVKSVA